MADFRPFARIPSPPWSKDRDGGCGTGRGGVGRGGEGTGREEVFRDEDTRRAWEWRAVKDNGRPVKGSEEQDAVLVPRRVAVFWCGALIGRQAGWIFDLRCWCAPNDTRLPSSADFDPCCSSVRPLP